jgi:hypothetical protein
MPDQYFVAGKGGAANQCTGTATASDGFRDGDLDRIARR